MKPLPLLLLAPLLASLAACAPAMNPVEASAKVVDAILQPGQTWVVNGVTPGGKSETFSLTLGEPRRAPDGRVSYPRNSAEAGTAVPPAGFIGMVYAPADELGPDMLSASWIRNGADGKINGLSGCILREPGRAKDKTRLPGDYLSLDLGGQPTPQKRGMGSCTMTLRQ
ncbi:hypothetical protein [Deinococcus aestuarii]|uniref:hypothetical protein n=1 Tax=Deinococcus aestuarii TaxID=2774531 RepID=UPI001C0E5493|nr:hypothetical protein [Deinococcus aestuarii]